MTIVLIAFLLVCLSLLARKYWDARSALKRYLPIQNLDFVVAERTKEAAAAQKSLSELQSTLKHLTHEVSLLNEDSDLASAGFYKSRYDFGDSKKYEERLHEIREKQKHLIKLKTAIICSTEWSVEGSKAKGKQMTDRTIKLGLSAFNVQCDNEILKVKFANIARAEEKLNKFRDNVDKLLEPNKCMITNEFFKLKLDELFLAYEYQEQVHKEKEEQRALKEQMRDEERAEREMERVQAEAEREESRYQEALDKARYELEKKSDADRAAFMRKIADLELKVKEASENRERAKSQAEQTRRGHVYIISNIGAFGEEVFKIGMTRRLDPMDRVWELSSAGVPFDFDVHALIKSEDAPGLERRLHEAFTDRRINRVNERKEFFRVSLQEIEKVVKKQHKAEFKLTLVAEAKEYRQSVAMSIVKKDEKLAA